MSSFRSTGQSLAAYWRFFSTLLLLSLLGPLTPPAVLADVDPTPARDGPLSDPAAGVAPRDTVPPPSLAESGAVQAAISTADRRLFEAHIRPLFQKHCLRCHGSIRKRSGLDLRTLEAVLRGGESGPSVVPGAPHESRLLALVEPDADPAMPPGKTQLSDDERALLEVWIERLGNPESRSEGAGDANPASLPPADPALPKAGLDPSLVVDWLLETSWKETGVRPAAPASDSVWMRRVWLDLVGRPPTAEETEAFLARTDSSKRQQMVDELLESREHARHLAEVFDVVLMGRPDEKRRKQRRTSGWTAWLEAAFRENRPWNEVVRQVILARPQEPSDRGAQWFVYERRNDHQALAKAAAPALFGIDMQCAQCHDHPIAPEILQAHYWGLVHFFARSRNVETAEGPRVAESAIGAFSKYADLGGENFPSRLIFFDGTELEETRPKEDQKEEDRPELYRVPPPEKKEKAKRPRAEAIPNFSRRAELARIAADESHLAARAFVNRVWALLYGRGLVHPVDRMDSTHPPSHPRLLAWLTRDFIDSGQDVRRLLRALVSTRAYGLDSVPRGPRPDDASFACAIEKPLSAEAIYRSMLVASGRWKSDVEDPSTLAPELARGLAGQFREVFRETYSATLRQTLFLSNNPAVDRLLANEPGTRVHALLELENSEAVVVEAFRHSLGRAPVADELAHGTAFLEARAERRQEGVRQLLWALLTSAEFLFNH